MLAFTPLIILAVIIIIGILYYLAAKGGSSLSSSSILYKFSKDLNQLAREKKLDPVIGREKEIARVVQILSRRNKNNPVLIGKAGIGKTAIVEGLAEAIINKKVPEALYGKRVLALDLTGILAGTKYRGEFEQRLKKVIDEIANAKRSIILFIDEIHILAEAGEAEGAINAADILKPLLARGELQVVGATTKDEYEKFIKQDKTLDRRLQPIFVSEPGPELTKLILKGIVPVYEAYHTVRISPEAIDSAIKLTKSIVGRAYPDKAIDAIDEACSMVRIEKINKKNTKEKTNVSAADVRKVVAEWKATF
ncbi:MAG: AAA family ATPase [Candidatus Buchananbacteria bacterium]